MIRIPEFGFTCGRCSMIRSCAGSCDQLTRQLEVKQRSGWVFTGAIQVGEHILSSIGLGDEASTVSDPTKPPGPTGGEGKTTSVEAKRQAVVPEYFARACFGLPTALPETALKFVPFIVSRKLRDAVEGDLAEDFGKRAARWGRPYALRVLWWDIAELCIRRFGPTAIVMGIGAWFRQKLGL